MTTVATLTEILKANPGLKASEIAVQLDTERRNVNQILYGNEDRFTKDNDHTWRLVPKDTSGTLTAKSDPVVQKRRPGPFGPARDLIPQGQQLEIITAGTPCHVALDRMAELNYSTLPIRNANGTIIGVFSWQGFSDRILGIHHSTISVKTIAEQGVEDCMLPANFLDPEEYIDTTVEWSDVDCVIVGTKENPEGILTVSDVWAQLNDFAEVYVLLHEIEMDLRTLISQVAGDQITKWITKLKIQPGIGIPKDLEGFNFSQYLHLISGQIQWPHFDKVLNKPKQLFVTEFEETNKIRNEVMHFRERASVSRCNQLRRFRETLRRAIK